MSDSLWHWGVIGLALLLALGGAVVVVVALFRDRSRGRARCPKCWYDMAGVSGLKCPECGREAKHAKKLHKTRRRWRRAVLGAAMVLIAAATAAGVPMLRKGPLKGAPAWSLIVAMPWLSVEGIRELGRRAAVGEMPLWEQRWFARRAASLLDDPRLKSDGAERAMLLGTLSSMFHSAAVRAREAPYVRRLELSELEDPRIVGPVVELQDDEHLGFTAFDCLTYCRASEGVIVARLLSILGARPIPKEVERIKSNLTRLHAPDGDLLCIYPPSWAGDQRRLNGASLYEELHACGGEVERMVRILIDGLNEDEPYRRTLCIWALWLMAPTDRVVQDAILACSGDREASVRATVVRFAAHVPLTDRTGGVIKNGLADRDSTVRVAAAQAAGAFGADGGGFLEALRPALEDPEDTVGGVAADAWVRCGGDRGTAMRALLARLGDGREIETPGLMFILGEAGAQTPESAQLIALLLESKKPGAREYAACAAARLGIHTQAATRVLFDLTLAARQANDPLPSILWFAAARGTVDVSLLLSELEATEQARRDIALRALAWAGAKAAEALPALRKLRDEANPLIGPAVEHAIKRIEWELENPEKAAKLRELPWPE